MDRSTLKESFPRSGGSSWICQNLPKLRLWVTFSSKIILINCKIRSKRRNLQISPFGCSPLKREINSLFDPPDTWSGSKGIFLLLTFEDFSEWAIDPTLTKEKQMTSPSPSPFSGLPFPPSLYLLLQRVRLWLRLRPRTLFFRLLTGSYFPIDFITLWGIERKEKRKEGEKGGYSRCRE